MDTARADVNPEPYIDTARADVSQNVSPEPYVDMTCTDVIHNVSLELYVGVTSADVSPNVSPQTGWTRATLASVRTMSRCSGLFNARFPDEQEMRQLFPDDLHLDGCILWTQLAKFPSTTSTRHNCDNLSSLSRVSGVVHQVE